MPRSLKVDHPHIAKVKASLKRSGFASQRALAEDLLMALSTVGRFLNGKPVDYATFIDICTRLNLDWQSITDVSSAEPSPDTPQPQLLPTPTPLNPPAQPAQVESTSQKGSLETASTINTSPLQQDQPPKRLQDWGEAIDIQFFRGRHSELAELRQFVEVDQCRLITLQGLGGVGKTSLAAKLARDVSPHFDAVIWRSLRNAPTLETLLQTLIPFLSDQQDYEASLDRLLHWLRSRRCLIILDNLETILESGQVGQYRQQFQDYGQLFRCLGETQHQSCILVTTREKPGEISILESDTLSVRTLQINGSTEAAQAIIQAKGLQGDPQQQEWLCQRYSNNPLAIKIVGTSIQALFEGNIDLFIQAEAPVFNDLRRLLNQQFERLSALEQCILYWLAIHRDWTKLSTLGEDIWPHISRADIFEALESLSIRSLIETRSGQYTQQPVIMEYVTERIISQVYHELTQLGESNLSTPQDFPSTPFLLCTHALIKTTEPDYIKHSQIRIILAPIAERLQATLRQPKVLQEYLKTVFHNLTQVTAGYGIGNFINLCLYLGLDLTHFDLSGTTIWQADFQGKQLWQVNFTQANFSNCLFTQAQGSIVAVAFSPTGDLLATGDSHGTIYLWDLYNPDGTQVTQYPGQLTTALKGHHARVWSLSWSPDGTQLVSGSADQTIKIWDCATGRCLQTCEGHQNWVWSVAWSPDGQTIASGSEDHTIRLWAAPTGQCLKVLQDHSNCVWSIAWNPDSTILASSSEDQTLRLWQMASGTCTQVMECKGTRSLSVDWSPDGQWLVSGTVDHTLQLWNPSTGLCQQTWTGHQDLVWSVAWSPDGKTVASGSADQTIRLWEPGSGQCQNTIQGHHNWVFSVAWSPDSQLLASGSYDQTAKLWKPHDHQCLSTLQGSSNWPLSLDWRHDGQALAMAGEDNLIYIWDIATGNCIQRLTGHGGGWIRQVKWHPTKALVASGSEDCTIGIWNPNTGQRLHTLMDHEDWVYAVEWSRDGQYLASASVDQTIKLWDAATGQLIRTLEGHDNWVWSLAWNPSGDQLASGSSDSTVRLWNVKSGQCTAVLSPKAHRIHSISWHPQEPLLATGDSNSAIAIWDTQTGQCLESIVEHQRPIRSVAWHPRGRYLASCSEDNTIRLWHPKTGQNLRVLEGHQSWVLSLSWNPTGDTLASSSADETLKLWSPDTGECLNTIQLLQPYTGMNITGATGLTEAQQQLLQALGAVKT